MGCTFCVLGIQQRIERQSLCAEETNYEKYRFLFLMRAHVSRMLNCVFLVLSVFLKELKVWYFLMYVCRVFSQSLLLIIV